MLQPLPLNPLMAPNGGLWFNRYKQFQFSIPLNYGRLEQHAATACERHRETEGRQAGRQAGRQVDSFKRRPVSSGWLYPQARTAITTQRLSHGDYKQPH